MKIFLQVYHAVQESGSLFDFFTMENKIIFSSFFRATKNKVLIIENKKYLIFGGFFDRQK
jgi:hypothetical protein